jgi:hypothetical protein
MIQREYAARFIEEQLKAGYECTREKGDAVHYGVQELRELLDYIYGTPPQSEREEIT